MAIWQFECYIVPKKNVCENAKFEMNDIISWGIQNASIELIDFLERQSSWSDKISLYGKEDETCIEFLYLDECLEEIRCRLDLRSISNKLLKLILDFINKIEGMILYENNVYPPNIEQIVDLIKCSQAKQFCQYPEEYLKEVSEREKQ